MKTHSDATEYSKSLGVDHTTFSKHLKALGMSLVMHKHHRKAQYRWFQD